MKKFLIPGLILFTPFFAFASSQSYTTPGTYTFTVPTYVTSLTLHLLGAGGGAVADASDAGGAGGGTQGTLSVTAAQNLTIIVGGGATSKTGGYGGGANGGSGASGCNAGGAGGGGRSALLLSSGTEIITAGGGGGSGEGLQATGGAGGGASGVAGLGDAQNQGGNYGGGGGTQSAGGVGGLVPGPGQPSGSSGTKGSGGGAYSTYCGGGGGGGYYGGGGGADFSAGGGGSGYCSGTGISACTTTQGAGAAGGKASTSVFNAGTNGSVSITWTVPASSCTVSLSPNPVAYGSSSKLSWNSSSATTMYINNVGYVTANMSGNANVSPASTTDYSCTTTGPGGNGSQPASLTVAAPPTPAATITASSTSIYVGQSTGLKATFAAGTGDTLTADNIDEPLGTGLGATTNPDATKYITFSPSQPGTYTFYALATTQYYTSWTSYASTVVIVAAAPECSVSLAPSSITQGQSATLYYSSANASAFSINNIGSETPDSTGSTTVSPSVTTDYTGTASQSGVQNTCPASLTVSCTPTYSCSGQIIQYTNASCQLSNVTTCESPDFCSSGSSSCVVPGPTFTPSGDLTGNLQVVSSLVRSGATASVYWNVGDVQSCTVSGTNGNSWSGTSSGVGGETTSPILQQTVYTLTCDNLSGYTPSSFTQTQTVNITPEFEEE